MCTSLNQVTLKKQLLTNIVQSIVVLSSLVQCLSERYGVAYPADPPCYGPYPANGLQVKKGEKQKVSRNAIT